MTQAASAGVDAVGSDKASPIQLPLVTFFLSASYPTWLFQMSSFLSFFSLVTDHICWFALGNLLEGLWVKGFPRGI